MPETYIVARNGGGRPTLQHRLGNNTTTTACGRDISGWSRAYTPAIPQILCNNCKGTRK